MRSLKGSALIEQPTDDAVLRVLFPVPCGPCREHAGPCSCRETRLRPSSARGAQKHEGRRALRPTGRAVLCKLSTATHKAQKDKAARAYRTHLEFAPKSPNVARVREVLAASLALPYNPEEWDLHPTQFASWSE